MATDKDNRPPVTSTGNRDAVESAIENAKRDKNSTWEEIAERPSRIPSWEDSVKGSKKVAVSCRAFF
jgi:hypothetical protein